MKIIVNSPERPTKENLKLLYDVFNKIFKNDNLYYNSNDVKKLKKDSSNTFISL